ncbi:MAG: hypothetical protein HRT89_02860 [Lentisphaeria bacterium]|nr:hypothetical protein [Lentisphaeria bacterium]NQZ66990.1 hypothetical protein [Lentisphaeria bacterium]
MKQILTLALLTFKLQFRQLGGHYIYIASAVLLSFIFYVCRADGNFLNEIEIRSNFSLYISISLLSLSLLWYSCLSMRGDIEAKRLHILTSYPMNRFRIFAGKWMGLFIYAMLGFVILLITLSVNVAIFNARWDGKDKASLTDAFRHVKPYIPSAEQQASTALHELKIKNPEIRFDEKLKLKEFERMILRRQQLVAKGTERRWAFTTAEKALKNSPQVFIRYRYYSGKKEGVLGTWSIAEKRGDGRYYNVFTTQAKAGPNKTWELEFPPEIFPESGNFSITYKGDHSGDLIFYKDSGLNLFYKDSHVLNNLFLLALVFAAHFAVVISTGLTIAVAFTLSVASFMSTVLYAMSMSSEFFRRALAEINDGSEKMIPFADKLIQFGIFITTGMEQPNVISSLSRRVLISSDNLGLNLTRDIGNTLAKPISVFSESAYLSVTTSSLGIVIGYTFYFILLTMLGVFLLKRKELDRIH